MLVYLAECPCYSFLTFLSLPASPSEPAILAGDVNHDGFVGQTDLDFVLADWGQGTPPVPEPTTLSLLGLCGLTLVRLRCRRPRPCQVRCASRRSGVCWIPEGACRCPEP